MPAQTYAPAPDASARSFPCSFERRIEAEVLLQAVTALRHDGMLTDAEFEAKRRLLTAQL